MSQMASGSQLGQMMDIVFAKTRVIHITIIGVNLSNFTKSDSIGLTSLIWPDLDFILDYT